MTPCRKEGDEAGEEGAETVAEGVVVYLAYVDITHIPRVVLKMTHAISCIYVGMCLCIKHHKHKTKHYPGHVDLVLHCRKENRFQENWTS